jgi:hypothetical protein
MIHDNATYRAGSAEYRDSPRPRTTTNTHGAKKRYTVDSRNWAVVLQLL